MPVIVVIVSVKALPVQPGEMVKTTDFVCRV
jgi:hypothetical protein